MPLLLAMVLRSVIVVRVAEGDPFFYPKINTKRDRNPYKSSDSLIRSTMGNSPVDRDKDYMFQTYGTRSLITDYWSMPHKTNDDPEELTEEEQNQE